jgi:hypothetical protein
LERLSWHFERSILIFLNGKDCGGVPHNMILITQRKRDIFTGDKGGEIKKPLRVYL